MQRALQAGVGCLALTDHDTTEGIAEALAAASETELELLPGVEISVTWGRQTVHIVGLRIDPDHPALQTGLASLREFRDWRAEEIGRRLTKHGIEGTYEGAKALSNGRLISRTHFARYLVRRGVEEDVRGVFKHYLVHGKPGHVSGDWARLEDGVGGSNAAGVDAVIAPPAGYGMTRS